MNTELKEKERIAMERLKAFEPEDGYFLAYSGGKDSDCIKILAQLAGIKFEAVHNLTTVDAPETVRYVRSQPDVRISRSYDRDGKPVTMWNLIVRKGTPPLRTSRYCCSELKEPGGTGKIVVTGVRWAESTRRKQSADVVKFIGKPKGTQKIAEELGADYRTTRQGGIVLNDDNDINRRMVEHCYRTRKTMVNPIVDWTDEDVWAFLSHYGCKSNPLYECGFKRIGCIGCPMASRQLRLEEFRRYSGYQKAYIRAFDKMLEKRAAEGKSTTEKWSDRLSGYPDNRSRAISVQCGQPYELQIFPFLHTKCHNELASRILNYLERHYMEDTTLDALAAVMNYTPQYLSRLIKRELGCNFVTLISMIRMAKAAECLARTEEKVYLLCARVGIPDQRYFSQKFKSVFGETPLQFRQNHAGMPTAQFQQQIWEKVNRWMGKDEEIVSLH